MGFAGVARGREEKRGRGLRAFGLLDFENEIFVWEHDAMGEFDALATVGKPAHGDLMGDGLDGSTLQAGVKINNKRNVMSGAALRMLDDGRDAGSVGNGVGVRGPSGSIVTNCWCSGNVARAHYHREDQAHASTFPE